jgi:hypothetical protein
VSTRSSQDVKPWTVLIFMVVDEDVLAPYALIQLRDVTRLGKDYGESSVMVSGLTDRS